VTGSQELGRSREGRPILGWRFGEGGTRISLIGGCHADEPAGPRLLRELVARLEGGDGDLLEGREWWIAPQVNPDGEERNRRWQERGPQQGDAGPDAYDLPSYLAHAVRELPGDDIEFGFPDGVGTVDGPGGPGEPRPENRALFDWWRTADGPFHVHASLHGMGFAAGSWLLIEPTWAERAGLLREAFGDRVREMGYVLHDVERLGEKGFFRLGRGFATRPDSRHMRDHFLARGDEETAARFRPSSMETIRALGGDPLTLVTEMPLFLTPGVGEEPGPPDRVGEEWKARLGGWKARVRGSKDRTDGAGAHLAQGDHEAEPRLEALWQAIREEAHAAGLRPMPVRDQIALQWEAILAGIRLVEGRSGP
jgi:hypothetical protein